MKSPAAQQIPTREGQRRATNHVDLGFSISIISCCCCHQFVPLFSYTYYIGMEHTEWLSVVVDGRRRRRLLIIIFHHVPAGFQPQQPATCKSIKNIICARLWESEWISYTLLLLRRLLSKQKQQQQLHIKPWPPGKAVWHINNTTRDAPFIANATLRMLDCCCWLYIVKKRVSVRSFPTITIDSFRSTPSSLRHAAVSQP